MTYTESPGNRVRHWISLISADDVMNTDYHSAMTTEKKKENSDIGLTVTKVKGTLAEKEAQQTVFSASLQNVGEAEIHITNIVIHSKSM